MSARYDVEDLKSYIAAHAFGAEVLDCYWIHGADAGFEYCHDCCVEEVERLHAERPDEVEDICVDGGWGTEHDSMPYCEKCGAALSGSLTEYGVSEELKLLEEDDAQLSPGDPYHWLPIMEATDSLRDEDERWGAVARVVEAARGVERAKAEREAELTASPGMAQVRTSLLSLLAARNEQRKAEPSFRQWKDLQRYKALPFEERREASKDVAALRKHLLREAEDFFKLLGYAWKGNCVSTPYGAYWWAYVVTVEQHRLWQTPAFLEGAAYARHPCPSGDPDWPHHRDANPYQSGSVEHEAWDCGYISEGVSW